MAKITASSKLTFGRHKGKKLSACDTKYLEWMVANLLDSDFHEWALAARAELKDRALDPTAPTGSLEEQADKLLRDAGFDP